MAIAVALTAYQTAVSDVTTMVRFATERYRSGRFKLPTLHREFIVESAFLKFFVAWEQFLETAFTDYMTGELSILGRPINRYTLSPSFAHANDILRGKSPFFDYSTPSTVLQFSRLMFHPGNVIDVAISSITVDFQDMKTIRNAAAHLSTSTSAKLHALAVKLLGRPPAQPSVSYLLQAIDPNSAAIPRETIFQKYITIIDIVTQNIAEG